MSGNSLLFSINNEGKVYALSTSGSCWREFMYLGLEFKTLSAVPHFLWAVGGDRQIYLHVHGLEIPIRVKEESYENERWLPLEGFSNRLLPTDRYHFSSQDGTTDRAIENIRLPSMAWQWEGVWQLELTLDGQPLDHDGWTYAVDFPAHFGHTKQWKSCVRRRKWIRYRKFCAMNSWCAIAPLHKDPTQEPFIDVSIGGNQIPYAPPGSLSVWAITAHGRVMYRAGVTNISPEGLKWINLSIPPNCDIKQISVGPTGLVWALLWTGRAIIRKGINKDNPTGESWLEVKSPSDTKLSVISVGYNVVWAVSTDNRVWFRKSVDGNLSGNSEEAAMGTGWLEITGNMSHISVGINDQVFAIGGSDKCIYWRSGVNPAELTGKRWKMVQANMQLSRTSSSASVVSSASNATKHHSLNMLNEATPELKSNIRLRSSWEESHSAPIEHTLPIKLQKDLNLKGKTDHENLDVSGKSYETTLKNPRAWSPVRSVGSVVGMEAHPDSDSSVFDVDSGLYFDEEVSQTAWGSCDASWAFVASGACLIDPVQLPHWFMDSHNSYNNDLNMSWRIQILDSLKKRNHKWEDDLSKYGMAIEEKGWNRSCESQFVNINNSLEDCVLSIYWHSMECIGTLSVFKPDGTIKFILNLGEVTSVYTSCEPGCPRVTLTAPRQSIHPIKVQFNTELEHEEWLNTLVDITSKINGRSGKPSTKSLWVVTASGDILNWDPIPPEKSHDGIRSYKKEFQVFGKDITNSLSIILHNNFSPENTLKISGCLFDKINRFYINLQGPEIKNQRQKTEKDVIDVPLHISVRFDENVTVCNTKIFGSWGTEERYELPLAPGQEFSLVIHCLSEGFKLVVNNNFFCFYEHRLSPETITSLVIQGPLKLYTMEYNTKTIIVGPDEMYYRMMGGYLRKVECCGKDVIWGISHDHRTWLYTGGWGGGVLKGLGSNEGIHAMTDTQTYCVYENQRWNPITGYTSTGLPTDRYMWSDITGKHKRTREHTKLLNRHWHWISEWMVDYNTPGGVDGDGWQYATDFPAPYHGKKLFTDCVRRRRWYRKAQINTEGPWVRVGNTALLDISLWANDDETISVWGITTSGDVIYRTEVSNSNPAGTHWEYINSHQSFIAISTCQHIVWSVGRKGELYYREGICEEKPGGVNWKLIEAPKYNHTLSQKAATGVKAISLTKGAAWVLLTNGVIVVRTGITADQKDGKQWKYLSDSELCFKQVSSGGCGREVWAVSAAGVLLRRLGVAPDAPAGSVWQELFPGPVHHVCVRGLRL